VKKTIASLHFSLHLAYLNVLGTLGCRSTSQKNAVRSRPRPRAILNAVLTLIFTSPRSTIPI